MAQIIFRLDNSHYVSWLFHSSHHTFYLWKSMMPASIHYKTWSQFCLLSFPLNPAANSTNLTFTLQFLLQVRYEQTRCTIPTCCWSAWQSPATLFCCCLPHWPSCLQLTDGPGRAQLLWHARNATSSTTSTSEPEGSSPVFSYPFWERAR